ncbi:MAG TPA: hypothetical protein VK306_14060 [Acidimicrobiales bacterium]|nr:hypothetical protein [Acidimicrobiales bacterium]
MAQGDLALDGPDRRVLIAELAGSARTAGRRAVVSGRWLGETIVELAPRVPIRDTATLSAHHDGQTGAALARSMVRSAGRVSAGVAAATGTAIAAQQLSIAGVVLVPFELAAETALVTFVELKLIVELHDVAGRPLPGGPLPRSRAALLAWTSGHALAPSAGPGDMPLGPGARRELAAALRSRFTRNLTTLAPLLTGAAAAGLLNRRATVVIGHRMAREMGLRR